MEFFFLLLGLGFFLYVIFLIERADQLKYDRKLNEMREFGLHQKRIAAKIRKK